MFNSKLKEENNDLRLTLKHRESTIKELSTDLHNQKLEAEVIENEHRSLLKVKENEILVRIDEETKKQREENNQLKQENAVLSSQVEILTKAFDNMGFDVKDMKGILDKLVDGLIAKGKINVIK